MIRGHIEKSRCSWCERINTKYVGMRPRYMDSVAPLVLYGVGHYTTPRTQYDGVG
jgi:hypothetical protein